MSPLIPAFTEQFLGAAQFRQTSFQLQAPLDQICNPLGHLGVHQLHEGFFDPSMLDHASSFNRDGSPTTENLTDEEKAFLREAMRTLSPFNQSITWTEVVKMARADRSALIEEIHPGTPKKNLTFFLTRCSWISRTPLKELPIRNLARCSQFLDAFAATKRAVQYFFQEKTKEAKALAVEWQNIAKKAFHSISFKSLSGQFSIAFRTFVNCSHQYYDPNKPTPEVRTQMPGSITIPAYKKAPRNKLSQQEQKKPTWPPVWLPKEMQKIIKKDPLQACSFDGRFIEELRRIVSFDNRIPGVPQVGIDEDTRDILQKQLAKTDKKPLAILSHTYSLFLPNQQKNFRFKIKAILKQCVPLFLQEIPEKALHHAETKRIDLKPKTGPSISSQMCEELIKQDEEPDNIRGVKSIAIRILTQWIEKAEEKISSYGAQSIKEQIHTTRRNIFGGVIGLKAHIECQELPRLKEDL